MMISIGASLFHHFSLSCRQEGIPNNARCLPYAGKPIGDEKIYSYPSVISNGGVNFRKYSSLHQSPREPGRESAFTEKLKDSGMTGTQAMIRKPVRKDQDFKLLSFLPHVFSTPHISRKLLACASWQKIIEDRKSRAGLVRHTE